MVNEQTNMKGSHVDIEYRRKRNAEEMRHQVITFALMILFTITAFIAVGYDEFSSWFTIPFIFLLALVQVAFQLYYFMHMSNKGHEAPTIFMYVGMLIAFVTILAFMTIIWW